MSQSIPTGYLPPGIPIEHFLSERIPATRAVALSNPCPGQQMMVEFPTVGQNFLKLKETPP